MQLVSLSLDVIATKLSSRSLVGPRRKARSTPPSTMSGPMNGVARRILNDQPSASVICHHPSVCLSSVTFVRPTQAIEIFGNVSTPFGTLAICDLSIKILRRSSQGNPSVGGLNRRGVAKYSDFGPFQGYISESLQDRRKVNH